LRAIITVAPHMTTESGKVTEEQKQLAMEMWHRHWHFSTHLSFC